MQFAGITSCGNALSLRCGGLRDHGAVVSSLRGQGGRPKRAGRKYHWRYFRIWYYRSRNCVIGWVSR